jgi:hypothetical protein
VTRFRWFASPTTPFGVNFRVDDTRVESQVTEAAANELQTERGGKIGARLLGRHASGHAGARTFSFSSRGNKFSDLTEAIWRHATVYGFVVAGLDDVRFVPDADIASAASDAAIEINPCRPELHILGSRIGFQMLKGAPVLHNEASETAVP